MKASPVRIRFLKHFQCCPAIFHIRRLFGMTLWTRYRIFWPGIIALVTCAYIMSHTFIEWSTFLSPRRYAAKESYNEHAGKINNKTSSGKNKGNRTILILSWTKSANGIPKAGNEAFKGCDKTRFYTNCLFTTDRSDLAGSDAVYFKTAKLGDYINDLPRTRLARQHWILKNREAPPTMLPYYKQFNDKFNLIINYRSDADIISGYGYIEPVDKSKNIERESDSSIWTDGKTDLVAWVVSHCETPSLRERYAAQLMKHIPVHVYGQCGNLSLGQSTRDVTKLKRRYKFYLAFENSLCPEYATEKVWNTLNADTVPVVLGMADYKKILPKGSYIDIRDFQSAESLAKYLKYLDGNDRAYGKYFEWKNNYVIKHHYEYYCKLCDYLHKNPRPKKTYSDLYSWLNICSEPKDFYKDIDDITL